MIIIAMINFALISRSILLAKYSSVNRLLNAAAYVIIHSITLRLYVDSVVVVLVKIIAYSSLLTVL